MKTFSLFSSGSPPATALGLYVTKQVVRVVILQRREETYVVADYYTRKRGKDFSATASEADSFSDDFSDGPPGEAGGDDYSISFGSEDFGDGGLPGGGSPDDGDRSFGSIDGPAQSSERSTDLAPLLREIMEAAESQYGSDLEVAFCVGAPEVNAELLQGNTSGDDEDNPVRGREKHLLARLNAESDRKYTADQVAFVPAASAAGGSSDTVAVIREGNDAVTGALSFLHDKSLRSLPLVQLMEAELTLYPALMEVALDCSEEARTVLLRIGTDDTLVMFLEGRRLRYQEYLRSITTLEAADTVCSRVLLQQDEAGIDRVDQIVLIAEDREEEFVDRLGEFYPESDVLPIGRVLAGQGITMGEIERSEVSDLAQWVPAIGVARRLLARTSGKELNGVNLLPRGLRRRKSAVQLAWHTIAMAVVLFLVGFFFSSRYYYQQEDIGALQAQIDRYPASLELTEDQLLARIDSLQNVYETYSQALVRLDTVLAGSDRWSRLLAETVQYTENLPGLWVEEWHPGETSVQLVGYSTNRDRVVQLSNRLNASVDRLTSASIRDYPVYRYSITAPLPTGLPRSVRYLREQELSPTVDDQSSVPSP
jgi:Tfp pilus assembly protein PilN